MLARTTAAVELAGNFREFERRTFRRPPLRKLASKCGESFKNRRFPVFMEFTDVGNWLFVDSSICPEGQFKHENAFVAGYRIPVCGLRLSSCSEFQRLHREV
jgi:hypothetical protein